MSFIHATDAGGTRTFADSEDARGCCHSPRQNKKSVHMRISLMDQMLKGERNVWSLWTIFRGTEKSKTGHHSNKYLIEIVL